MGLPVRVEGKAHFFGEVGVCAVAKHSRSAWSDDIRPFSDCDRRAESISKSTVEFRREWAGVV